MAKRVRDYKAEERRRNELARQRGYTSRAQERGAKVRAKKAARSGNVARPIQHPLLRDERLLAQSWSEIHSHKEQSAYSTDFTDKQLREYLEAYVYDSRGKKRKDKIRDYLTSHYPEDYPSASDRDFWLHY